LIHVLWVSPKMIANTLPVAKKIASHMTRVSGRILGNIVGVRDLCTSMVIGISVMILRVTCGTLE